MKPKKIFRSFFCFVFLIAVWAHAEETAPQPPPPASDPVPPVEATNQNPSETDALARYELIYKSGAAPFKPKTKVSLLVKKDGLEVIPVKRGRASTDSSPWNVVVGSIRGAQGGKDALWLYWFDSNEQTLQGMFEVVGQPPSDVASVINKLVTDFHQGPVQWKEGMKERYEEYKDKALKESR